MQQSFSCGCVGPRPGEPLCPCKMRGLIKRKGRWIQPERDRGPVQEARKHDYLSALQGFGQTPVRRED